MQSEQIDHLSIWNALETTDPKYAKDFTKTGGFKGTAINATYVARKLTAMFGPVGTGWGYTILDEQYVTGAPILANGNTLGHEIIHVLRIKLWYDANGHAPENGDKLAGRNRGEVEHFGQTTFVGRNKNGIFTDEEAPKKSLTDAITKAASLLGCSADVYMGMFEDNKHINQQQDNGKVDPNSHSRPGHGNINNIKKAVNEAVKKFNACTDQERFREINDEYAQEFGDLEHLWREPDSGLRNWYFRLNEAKNHTLARIDDYETTGIKPDGSAVPLETGRVPPNGGAEAADRPPHGRGRKPAWIGQLRKGIDDAIDTRDLEDVLAHYSGDLSGSSKETQAWFNDYAAKKRAYLAQGPQ